MSTKELKQTISYLQKRFGTAAYKPRSYFDLTSKKRGGLLQDFSLVLSTVFETYKRLSLHTQWWEIQDRKKFIAAFERAWLTRYLMILYVKAVGTNSVVDRFLNDAVYGRRGALAQFREHVSNPGSIAHLRHAARRVEQEKLKQLQKLMDQYHISFRGNMLNVWNIVTYRIRQGLLPLQVFLAKILPGKRWPWKKQGLIQDTHLDVLEPLLKKGDILLQRTNFILTNATMPGFWTHAMLYDGEGSIIESTPYQVRRVPWRSVVRSDYLCVLRPKCSSALKKKAVSFARAQVGKPYDLSFDFLTDEALVCSELILKSYPHLKPRLKHFLGTSAFPPSDFILLLNEGKLDFVYFLDSRLHTQKVIFGNKKDLSRSYVRSRWDLLQK